MTILERKEEILQRLGGCKSWEERFKELLKFAQVLPPFPLELKKEESLVPGCFAKVWLVSELKEGKLYFQGESEAASMKGMIGLLLYIYSGSTPQEILSVPADFLQETGLIQHLSLSRRNGVANLYKMVHQIAQCHLG